MSSLALLERVPKDLEDWRLPFIKKDKRFSIASEIEDGSMSGCQVGTHRCRRFQAFPERTAHSTRRSHSNQVEKGPTGDMEEDERDRMGVGLRRSPTESLSFSGAAGGEATDSPSLVVGSKS